ncbi:MAG: peptidoglycan DD-metalloendopeptidase family protein [Bacteroidia bacterium]|nr:peptidoglycan DD-metalloendopeptidase family protein [Bacteroidia bacterium]
MGDEILLLNERIELNRIAIEMMENDIIALKEDYSRAIVNSYKSKKSNPDIIYILSAKDFNQGYKRLKYLQQVTKYRRNESEIIAELKVQVEITKEGLENDLARISDIKRKEEVQKGLLQNEQTKKQKMIRSLSSKEKQLKKELEEKKRIAKKLESEIARIIAEERKKSSVTNLTPEQKLIGENFVENKGRLPWPVERGIITNHFGVHQHPVLKYVTENNFGIEITSSGKTLARSIYKGEVTRIFAISGANMTVIIRHGKYLSVYNNLVNVKVKTGDKVDTKQELGEVFRDPGEGSMCIMKFMIFEEKYLDPEQWIAKI